MFKYFYYGFNISSLLHYEEVNRANCTAAWIISCAPPRDRHAVYAARRLFGFVYKSKKDLHLNLSNIEKKKVMVGLTSSTYYSPKVSRKESLLWTSTIPRRFRVKRNIHGDEIVVFHGKDKDVRFHFPDNSYAL